MRIIHLSDLHLSENLFRGAGENFKLNHRYGHDVTSFLALDSFLKTSEWDVLVITGDISRIGNKESFEAAKNWLQNNISQGNNTIGLNLSEKSNKKLIVIPGNHDRFNGNLIQSSLDNYHQEFDTIKAGTIISLKEGENTINFHLFDSSYYKGGFAYGNIEESSLINLPKKTNEIYFALLHHHFIQPPSHKREHSTELDNSLEVATFMLNADFDGVFFGHTHHGYINNLKKKMLISYVNDRRKRGRFYKRFIPKYFLKFMIINNPEDTCLVSFKREKAKNGQFPSLERYFEYLYYVNKGFKLISPIFFQNINEFYKQLNNIREEKGLNNNIKELLKENLLISLAPSACQAEATEKGFHIIDVVFNQDNEKRITYSKYQFNGAQYISK